MPIRLKDIADIPLLEASARLSLRRNRVDRVKSLVDRSSGVMFDTEARRMIFQERENELRREATPVSPVPAAASLGLERMLGVMNDILSIEFLEAGIEAGKAVGRLELQGGLGAGTGFLVCPDLLITNHHVLPDDGVAQDATFTVLAEDNKIGPPRSSHTYYLDPGRFFYTHLELDFTLVAIDDKEHLSDAYGWLPLLAEQGKILIGHPVNLIQHPQGQDKKVVVHDSRLLDLVNKDEFDPFCWYSADTERGSSGSPVFNNHWEVIALHHRAVPATNKNGNILDVNGKVMSEDRYRAEPHNIKWVANEGVRASRIVQALRDASLSATMQNHLSRTLALWSHPKAKRPGLKIGWY